jgi:tRNA dimethylallyltransferase
MLPVIVLTGPTGSGKSHWAMQLAATLPVEIISVDSTQVFCGLDIGSAKPTAAERASVPHHLIDIRDPATSYSAGDFVRDARSAIADIHGRGRLPLLVGGTLLYLRALYHGMAQLPAASADVRARLDAEALRAGWEGLHMRLQQVDPTAAARIHRNDAQRIQRALEVHELTGRTISSWQAATQGAAGDFHWMQYALIPADRAALADRLARRFDQMLRDGLAHEVQQLHLRKDLHARLPAIRSVGYRQLWEWCEARTSLEIAGNLAVIATRQLAKRQLTWLRAELQFEHLDAESPHGFPHFAKNLAARLARA